MKPVRDVLRLLAEGVSQRAISHRCGVSRQAVQDYAFRARQAGLGWPLPPEMDDFELEQRLFPAAPKQNSAIHPQPDWEDVRIEMKRKGATLMVLHDEYRRQFPDGMGYVRFCQLYREYLKSLRSYLRGNYRAGEYAFVDFAGPTVTIYPFAGSGQKESAQIFVGVLGASGTVYAEAVRSQKLPEWLACHTRMYEAWGGTPEIVVPDNLKSAVIRPDRYAPEINESYRDHARHYGVSIIPARPWHPRDKAKAEQGVQLVERWILFRLRKIVFTSLADLNAEIRKLLEDLNHRTMKRVRRSRAELFDLIDRPALQPLPAAPYEYAEFALARVSPGYHFTYEQHEYSVPFGLINQQIKVRATCNSVEAYFQGRRVASHIRSHVAGGVTTDPHHRDPKHSAYLEWNREEAHRKAAQIGPSCLEFLQQVRLRERHIQHEQRAANALRRMVREFGPERVETACRRAIEVDAISANHINNLLRNHRESLPLRREPDAGAVIQHENLRGGEEFARYLAVGGRR